MIRVLVILMIIFASSLASANNTVLLKLGGTVESFSYLSKVLTRALEASGYNAQIENVGEFPTTRLELMLEQGQVSAFSMGETENRNERFLAVRVGMTHNMIGNRVFFIPKGSQHEYAHVQTLKDFLALGKVAGMGEFWGDVAIWRANGLSVTTIAGNWKNLYRMVASGSRKVDYLSRGVQEIAKEWQQHPDLEVEQKLVFVYQKDHILYVTPKDPVLRDLLETVLLKAEDSGLIEEIVHEHYPEIYNFPVNLGDRMVIPLISN